MNEITITRALAEIKTLDNRISKAVQSTFILSKKKEVKVINGKKINEINSIIQGNFDSVVALIARRHSLKRAVVLSNATTEVQVNDMKMTVAEAIDLKNTISLEKSLVRELKTQKANYMNQLEVQNERESKNAEAQAQQNFGTKQKNDADAYAKFIQDYMDRHSIELIDPIDIASKIEKLDEYITNFETEIDFCLSENNATVKISID